MIFKSTIFKVLTLRSKSIITTSHGIELFQESQNHWLKQKCPPCVFVSTIKAKTLNLKKQKKNLPSVKVWKNITVKELADALQADLDSVISHISQSEVIKNVTPSTKIQDFSLLGNITKAFYKKCVFVTNPQAVEKKKEIPIFEQPPSKPENLVKRPPVVTIMGHVDHGKTTLLDALRNSFVVQQEFGGITQHIGAFSVEVKSGQKITFIDTPGHAAFTAMRSRGAQVTDLVVLVIAADDGIMDQTIESINIANKAGVPIVVAVNKIDKANAISIDKIKEKLMEEGIQVEDKGGNVQLVPISALKKINLDVLVEVILVEAEMMGLKGDPTGLVEGVIIESKMDQRGKLATVIVKRGTLTKGKILVSGKAEARVRIMMDENGRQFTEALPSTPIQVWGWKELPVAGDEVFEVKSEKDAKKFIRVKEKEEAMEKAKSDYAASLEKADIFKTEYLNKKLEFSQLDSWQDRKRFYYENFKSASSTLPTDNTVPTLNLIIKGDVHGSLEVLLDVIGSYSHEDECIVNIIDFSIGNITPSDVVLANSSNALIFAFNVKIHPEARELINESTNIRFHNVLYRLIDDLKSELNARIPPKDEEEVIGEAEVLENFFINVGRKKVPVAGSKCVFGELKKDLLYKVKRDDEVIYEGKLISMKHHKNEVGTIKKNTECGLMMDSFSNEFKPGDRITCYRMIKVPQKTSWNPGF